MRNAGLEETQAGIKIAGRNINHLRYAEIQSVHPKGYQSWVFIGRTDAEAEPSIIWPLDAKNRLIGKDSDAGKLKE